MVRSRALASPTKLTNIGDSSSRDPAIGVGEHGLADPKCQEVQWQVPECGPEYSQWGWNCIPVPKEGNR